MRNLKKVLSLSLALVMLLGMMIVGAGAVDTGFADDASISDSYEAAAAVNKALGLMTGDGTNLNPTANITRAEAFILTLRVDGSNTNEIAQKWPVSEKPFDDVSVGKWYAPYLAYGKETGLIAGSNGSYRPDEQISARDFSILLLAKLEGFNAADYQGAGYRTNSLRDAMKAGLYEELVNVNADKALTREEACQMVFNALIYTPDGGMIYPIVNGDKTMEFDNMKDAILYASLLGSGWIVGEPYKDTTGSLGERAFGLKPTSGTDDMGRNTTTWTANGGVKVVLADSSAAKVYTGAVKASQIYADLGLTKKLTGNTSATDKNTYHVDGVNFVYRDWVSDDGADAKDKTYTNKTRDYTQFQFELSADGKQVFGGNGAKTEVYYDGTNVQIVVTNTYVGKVTDVVPAKGETKAKTTINVVGNGGNGFGEVTCETEAFEKGDYVIFTWARRPDGIDKVPDGSGGLKNNTDGTTIKSCTLAEKVEGVLVSRISSKGLTADGVSYAYSGKSSTTGSVAISSSTVDADGTTKYDLYLDNDGNIIRVDKHDPAASAAADYVFVLKADSKAAEGSETIGNQIYWVQYVDTNGTVHTVKTSQDLYGNLSKTVGAYTVAEDTQVEGTYKFTKVTEKDSSVKTTYITSGTLKTGNPTLGTATHGGINKGSVIANADTLFVIESGTDSKSYAAYTGIKNLPTYVKEKGVWAMVKDGFAVAVFTEAGTDVPAGATSDDLVYVVSNTAVARGYDADAKTAWKEYAAIVEGEVTTIRAKADTLISGAGFASSVVKDTNGYVTSVTVVSTTGDGVVVAGAAKKVEFAAGVLSLTKSDNQVSVYSVSDEVKVYLVSGGSAEEVELKDIAKDWTTGNYASADFKAVQVSTTDEALTTIVVTLNAKSAA